jgi:D-amino-acid oxidase
MIRMKHQVAIVGAGVSGLTCGLVFVEHGYRTAIFAKEIGQQTTSGAAAALWFPYDAEPADKVIPWALGTYRMLIDLARNPDSGVSMIELRQFSRTEKIHIPDWAIPIGARAVVPSLPPVMSSEVETSLKIFKSGFSLRVPLMDTTIYLDYLADRFLAAGGSIAANTHFAQLEDVDQQFGLVINCAGIGARELVRDTDLEPHRGQVAIVPRIKDLPYAVVCDDAPLMYAIPRRNDCVLGGTNELSNNLAADSATTTRIVAECTRALKIEKPNVLGERVGLRPFRKSGVRVERDQLRDGRAVVHNYGHGGCGFTLSWSCAEGVFEFATDSAA